MALVWQALWPSAQAMAQAAGLDVKNFMCAPGSTPTTAVEQQLTEILHLAGKIEPPSDTETEHCSNCLAPPVALLSTQVAYNTGYKPSFTRPALPTGLMSLASPRGPPLGSRAPPFFA